MLTEARHSTASILTRTSEREMGMELTSAKLLAWRRRAEYTRDNATDPVDRGAALRELALMDALTEAQAQREGNYAMWHDEHDRLVAVTAERDALAKKVATSEDQLRQCNEAYYFER